MLGHDQWTQWQGTLDYGPTEDCHNLDTHVHDTQESSSWSCSHF